MLVRPWFRFALAAGVVAVAALTRCGTRWPRLYYMTGPSMEPTVGSGEYFLAWTPAGDLRRGDLLLFRYVDEDGAFHVLRRLVGLPGDTVAMQHGAVLINGSRPEWPYRVIDPAAWRSPFVAGGDLFTWGALVVPPDSAFLLADTRDMLGWPDSRFVGFVAHGDLVGRAGVTVTGRRLR